MSVYQHDHLAEQHSRCPPMIYNGSVTGFWPSLQYQTLFLCRQLQVHLENSYSLNVHAIVAPMGTSYLAGQYYSIQALVLSLAQCIAPSRTMEASQQGVSFQFSFNLICVAFGNRILSPNSDEQPRAMAITCIFREDFVVPFTNNSKECIPLRTLGFLYSSLWLLIAALSTHVVKFAFNVFTVYLGIPR